MAAVGPVLGGWLTSAFSWEWAFWINLPFGALVVVGVMLCVAESREHSAGRFTDWIGAGLSVLGFGLFVFGLIEGRAYGWWTATDSAPFSFGEFSVIPVLLDRKSVV